MKQQDQLSFRLTTSWDDGDPLDLALAERLLAWKVRGTFYIPQTWAGRNVMSGAQIRELRDMGFEVGAHTQHHLDLTQLSPDEVKGEMVGGKAFLEDVLQEKVTSFCYPKGRVNRAVRDAAQAAGYELARTTVSHRLSLGTDPFMMPVTIHAQRQPLRAVLTHSVRTRNVEGFRNWVVSGLPLDPVAQARSAAEVARRDGGVVHVWGHSWELERMSSWDMLQRLLEEVLAGDPITGTNAEAALVEDR